MTIVALLWFITCTPNYVHIFSDEPDCLTVQTPSRHPSIAHLLKKKWHSSIRARIEGRQEEEVMMASKKAANNKLYKSAPRVVG